MTPGIVVVGGGIAAQSLCEEIRERDAAVPLTMIGGEPCLPYDRVRLSELLVSDEEPASLSLRPREWYADREVRTLLGRRVACLDTGLRRLTLEDQEEIPYDRLVLATGSEPLLPSLPGLDLPGVLPFRGPEHCEEIRAAARGGAPRVAVIGGGGVGMCGGLPFPAPRPLVFIAGPRPGGRPPGWLLSAAVCWGWRRPTASPPRAARSRSCT